MGLRAKFALWLALLCLLIAGCVALAGLALWTDLNPLEREALAAMLQPRIALAVVLVLLLPFALAAALQWWMAAYPVAAARLREELRIIHAVNTEHRASTGGASEMRQLADSINAFAAAHGALRRDVETRIEEANAHLAQERNRLAALMSELAQSVLVCNSEGRILLYNARALQLLQHDAAEAAGSPVGLGRSIFGILDKGAIVHALDKIAYRLEQHAPQAVAHFVTTRAGQLLRALMAPVIGARGDIGGFVLVLEDITRSVEIDSRRDLLLRQLTEGTRASLANIRAAAETVQRYPDMDEQRRLRFTEVIRDEAERLSLRLDETLAGSGDALRAQWPLEDMLASDLAFALQRNFEAGLGVAASTQGLPEPLWLSVDSHALVQALTHVMGRISQRFDVRSVAIDIAAEGRHARLTLRWSGQALDPAVLHEWEGQPFTMERHATTLKDVLAQHGGEWWCHADRARGENQLCVQLPTVPPELAALPSHAAQNRPVYYDFDLFNQPGQTPELDERLLTELAYTVFDTETTGLSPSEGDEIIAIGAVRIVNGRLLVQECYEQLVDPRRPVRRESQQVHGISSQMLAGQPTIEQVLPVFHRFAEDTVLVAHNAAFDMRFLQLKEAQTGVRFTQPVLDTLMLSALAHPAHADAEHRLEQIAARLGVQVVGRHTALGDAMATGEVFLKLIPLLADRGIRTLRQAREASRKTPYAKLDY